jgi:putative transposase
LTMRLIEDAVKAGARREKACEQLGIDLRTYQRWLKRGELGDLRAGPKTEPGNKLSAKERDAILKVLNSDEFRDLSPSQVVPRLAERGIYLCSEATMFRLLKEEKQLEHRGRAKEPVDRIPVRRVATRPNQVWSWDITYLRGPVRGTFLYLYMVVDIWSRKVVGWAVHAEESAQHASELIQSAARDERVDVDTLTLHSDNGGPMKGSTMLATLQSLGIVASFTRPRVSDDNAFSEALFRTLKYRPDFPSKPFQDLAHATRWVADFVRWYNYEHRHSGIAFVRPIDRHEGRDVAILEARKAAYDRAKNRHPERWGSRPPRSWKRPERVVVRARRNPDVDGASAKEDKAA